MVPLKEQPKMKENGSQHIIDVKLTVNFELVSAKHDRLQFHRMRRKHQPDAFKPKYNRVISTFFSQEHGNLSAY